MKISRLQILLVDCFIPVVFYICYILSRLMHVTLPTCYVRKFGIVCPACGGTRCIIAFTNAEFVNSFKCNAYIFLTIIFLVIALLFLNITVFSNNEICKRICLKILNFRLVILWAITFLLFGVVRNLI